MRWLTLCLSICLSISLSMIHHAKTTEPTSMKYCTKTAKIPGNDIGIIPFLYHSPFQDVLVTPLYVKYLQIHISLQITRLQFFDHLIPMTTRPWRVQGGNPQFVLNQTGSTPNSQTSVLMIQSNKVCCIYLVITWFISSYLDVIYLSDRLL